LAFSAAVEASLKSDEQMQTSQAELVSLKATTGINESALRKDLDNYAVMNTENSNKIKLLVDQNSKLQKKISAVCKVKPKPKNC
jgi:hypothetical protein